MWRGGDGRGVLPDTSPPAPPEPLRCKDCENWYGAEDDEFGPCMLKNMRGDRRYITQGVFKCDEGRTVADREAPP